MLSIKKIAFIFYQKITWWSKDDIVDQNMILLIPGTAVTSASPSVKLYAGPLENFCIVWTWRYDRLLYELRKYLFASGFQYSCRLKYDMILIWVINCMPYQPRFQYSCKRWQFFCIGMIWNMKIWVITCKPHQPGFQYPCKRWQRRGCCQSCSNPRQGLCWKACVHWKYWYLCQDICTLHKTHVFEIYRSAKSVKMSIQWIFPIYISTCLPTELCLKVWCGYLQRAIIWLCYIIYAPVI